MSIFRKKKPEQPIINQPAPVQNPMTPQQYTNYDEDFPMQQPQMPQQNDGFSMEDIPNTIAGAFYGAHPQQPQMPKVQPPQQYQSQPQPVQQQPKQLPRFMQSQPEDNKPSAPERIITDEEITGAFEIIEARLQNLESRLFRRGL